MSDPALAPVQRSDEILDLIRGTFAEKGFDGASMQDLARAAGMSVGNFYRYFPSKAAIVEAIVMRDLASVERDFALVVSSPDPMGRLREILRYRIDVQLCQEDSPLWAEITAMAHRNPEIGQICAGMEAQIVRALVRIFARVTALAEAEAQARFAGHAGFVVMLAKAWALDAPHKRAGAADLKPLLLRTIDATLDEVADFKAKG
ncbi:TetR family transcriptional regulator [Cereibacter ovatus]|uniref:TetR family transcriptional regulator n=1 Tax=Cereibacter ovatus TaxID=439529 RepID=A0A285D2Y9_9RHOB|nr:TetR/AcrR family transcriptional regulator [Cereibacter ovatus]SNX73668.1 TetR family transcriptional regulator [Cereibacter ovatus]